MNPNKPNFDSESWLLPYKPTNDDVKGNAKKAGKKEIELERDSKNRRIIIAEALYIDKNGQKISVPSHMARASRNTRVSSDTGPSSNPGPSSIPGPSSPDPSSIPVTSSTLVSHSIPVTRNTPVSSSIPDTSSPGPSTIPVSSCIPVPCNILVPSSISDPSSPGPSTIPVSSSNKVTRSIPVSRNFIVNNFYLDPSSPGPSSIPVSSSIPVFKNIPVPSSVYVPSCVQLPSSTPVPNSPSPSTISVSTSTPVSNSIPGTGSIPTNAPSNISGSKPSNRTSQTPDSGKKHQGKMTSFQRKFEQAVSTPVTFSKAESMMLKMGWSGGALGKTGGGITEPIVPNLAYAKSTKGFGQLPSPPPKKPKKVNNPATTQVKPVKVNNPTQPTQVKPIKVNNPTQPTQVKPVKVNNPAQPTQVKPVKVNNPTQPTQVKPIKVNNPTQPTQVKPVKVNNPAQPVTLDELPPTKFIKPAPPKFIKLAKRKNGKQCKSNPERERYKEERRQIKAQIKSVFQENVMQYILDFVKNEREIAILFDKTLHNGQRKAIHNLVEGIRRAGEPDVLTKVLKAKWNEFIYLDIVRSNRYLLQSQSEGNPPYRYLCLFKEAPEYMFLVTRFKLNDTENDFVKREDVVIYHIHNKKKRKSEKFLKRNATMFTDKKCTVDKDNKIVKESSDTNAVRKIGVDDESEKKSVSDSKKDHDTKNKKDHNTENEDSDSETEKYCDSDNENDIEMEQEIVKTEEFTETDEDDGNAKMNENNEQIKTDIDEEINEIVERTAAGACRITENYKISNIRTESIPNSLDNITENEMNESVIVKHNTVKSEETKPVEDKIEPNIKDIEHKTDSNDAVTISILKSSRKEFMRYNLNMCFTDFIKGNVFKEFKFLGDFDMEEFEVLTEFLRDFFLLTNNKEARDQELMGIWNAAECKLSFKRDINGGIVIYKE